MINYTFNLTGRDIIYILDITYTYVYARALPRQTDSLYAPLIIILTFIQIRTERVPIFYIINFVSWSTPENRRRRRRCCDTGVQISLRQRVRSRSASSWPRQSQQCIIILYCNIMQVYVRRHLFVRNDVL